MQTLVQLNLPLATDFSTDASDKYFERSLKTPQVVSEATLLKSLKIQQQLNTLLRKRYLK